MGKVEFQMKHQYVVRTVTNDHEHPRKQKTEQEVSLLLRRHRRIEPKYAVTIECAVRSAAWYARHCPATYRFWDDNDSAADFFPPFQRLAVDNTGREHIRVRLVRSVIDLAPQAPPRSPRRWCALRALQTCPFARQIPFFGQRPSDFDFLCAPAIDCPRPEC
jgi:hypothetical protein